MRILITGGNGNIAKMIKKNMHSYYEIINPSRLELDLTDLIAFSRFIDNNEPFDILVHTAIIGGRRTKTDDADVVFKNVLMLENILKYADRFKMIIHFDSAAIYNRNTDILNRKEDDIFTIPHDYYGFSKYVIYQRSMQYNHFYNLRIFNIFHINEEPDRFIKSCFLAKQNNTTLTIYNDKYFDFVYESDFMRIIKYYFEQITNQSILEKTLNICYNTKYKLSDIAKTILPENQILVLGDDAAHNYSGNGNKLYNMNIHLDGLEESLHIFERDYVTRH